MELIRVWQVLLRRWWLIAIPVVMVALVAVPDLLRNEQVAAGGFQASFRYSAAQGESNLPQREGDYQDVWLASEFVVNAFTDWMTTSTFRDELAALVGTSDVAGLTIIADNNRSIGVVQLYHPNEAALNEISRAATTVLQTRNHIYFPHLGERPAEVTIIDAPVVFPQPPPLTNRFAPIFQLGVAVFGGLLLALAAEYFDQTLRTADEIEASGLPVLASIPKE